MRKDNYGAFLKHFLVYNPILGEEFLEQIKMHFDMSSKPKMLIEKLQMLITSYVNYEQKVKWLK